METNNDNSKLTPDEKMRLASIEARIQIRASGRVGTGRDLIEVQKDELYRDYGTFDEYVDLHLEVDPSTAYRWIDAANVVNTLLSKFSPLGEKMNSDGQRALVVLTSHRNETACRDLSKLWPNLDVQWAVYVKAVQLAKNREPKPRHLKQAARRLGHMAPEDPRDSRTINKMTALKLIAAVRDAAKADGRFNWAERLDDALARLGYQPDRIKPPRLPRA